MPLKWAFSNIEGKDKKPVKDVSINLPSGTCDYLDIASTYHKRTDLPRPEVRLQLHFLPEKYKDFIKPRVSYLLEIVVTADDAAPRKIWLKFDWDGEWQGLKAEEVKPGWFGSRP